VHERSSNGSLRLSQGRGARRRRSGAALAAALALLPPGLVRAAEFERLEVSEDSGTYRIGASLFMDAPPDAVVGALLDFEEQKGIGPPIRDVEVVGTAPAGGKLVRVVTDICIGPFCTAVKQLQVIRFLPPGTIQGTVVPQGGDLRSGNTTVEVSPREGRTRVEMDCTFQPSRRRPFFLPKGWVLNAIRRQARQSAAGLERLAARIASSRTGSSRSRGTPGEDQPR
jgi:Polyketide cyclase / dehydrase and lipid transport